MGFQGDDAIIYHPNIGTIATVYFEMVGMLANARLIAAAPDLLEICKAGVVFAKALRAHGNPWNESDDYDLARMERAIAKAEGRE